MKEFRFTPKEIAEKAVQKTKEVATVLAKNKGRIAVGVGLVVGNTAVAAGFLEQNHRINELEHNVGKLQKINNVLIDRDILLTQRLCETDIQLGIDEGDPDAFIDREEDFCDRVAEAGQRYWREIVEGK